MPLVVNRFKTGKKSANSIHAPRSNGKTFVHVDGDRAQTFLNVALPLLFYACSSYLK